MAAQGMSTVVLVSKVQWYWVVSLASLSNRFTDPASVAR